MKDEKKASERAKVEFIRFFGKRLSSGEAYTLHFGDLLVKKGSRLLDLGIGRGFLEGSEFSEVDLRLFGVDFVMMLLKLQNLRHVASCGHSELPLG